MPIVISVPFSFYPLNKGCEQAHTAVASALRNISSSDRGTPLVFTSDSVSLDGSTPMPAVDEALSLKARQVFSRGDISVFVGGDHGVTFPLVKAFAEKHTNPGIVIFDAHPDCSEASCLPHRDDLVLALVREKVIKPEHILIVGVRQWQKGELQFLRENKIKYYTLAEISSDGAIDVCDAVMSVAKDFGSLYVSIDMDVVDPAFAPGVSTPEAGGLSGRELLYFIQRLKLLKNFRAADVMEINPEKDRDTVTVRLGAKVVAELLSSPVRF